MFFGGARVPNFGHFRALETPGGDLGFQGSILGRKTGRQSSFGAPIWGGFGMLLGSVFEVFFWKASGSRFWWFWHGSGLNIGVVLATFWTQKGSLHQIMNNSFFAAIYCTSGMSQIPKTNNFTFSWLCFSRHCFRVHISAIFVNFGVPWRLYQGTFDSLVGVMFRVFEKGLPEEFESNDVVVSPLPRGAQRRHLAKAKWLSY